MKILRALKSWPWYYWLVALLVPGGLLLVALRSSTAGGSVPTIDPDNAKAGEKLRIDQLIGSIKDKADALRSGLANDPLAANLLGVDPALIKAGDATKVADTSAKKSEILKLIEGLQWRIGYSNEQYGIDHFGGQSPDGFASYIASLEAQIAQAQTQLVGL